MSYLEDLFSLVGRAALVTGAAGGNGRAIAAGLLSAGAEVVLVDKDDDRLSRTVDEFKDQGLTATAHVCDLADDRQIEELIGRVSDSEPGLSILVNNAGITLPGNDSEYSIDDWDLTHRINLRAPFILSQGLARALAASDEGVIINITSINAELAFPGNPAYVAFKGGLCQLTKAMALDLADMGIRVNAIGPGYMRTAMTDASWRDPVLRAERSRQTILGRWGEPEELAGAAVFLASRASSYVTGQTLYVDGGWLAKGM